LAINNYDITAAAFLPESAHKYELSILTGMDSFAYIIRDRIKNQLLAYNSKNLTAPETENWTETINRIIQADDKLRSLRFNSCILGWQGERITLVPDELYTTGNDRSYLEQLTLVGLEDEVRAERFHFLEGHLIFAAERVRLDAAERRLSSRRTHHLAGGLLTAWGTRSRRLGHQSVSVAIRGGNLFVAAHRNGVLQFFNTFPYTNSQDALYYLLLAYQQCGWAPSRVPLYLCGEITEHSELYRQFYRYVEDIRFCQYGAPPSTPPELAGLPGHIYFELLCLG
jgi:hypothetical protein